MKAQELRVGNWFMDQFGEKTICHGIIGGDFFNEILGDVPCSVSQPIHLTEQWLVYFGFQRSYINGFWNGVFKIIQKAGSFNRKHGFYLVVGRKHIHIQHVHQLQNLYFALTGEELQL